MRWKISKFKIPILALVVLLAPASVVVSAQELEPLPSSMTVLQEPIDYSESNAEGQSTNEAQDNATNTISGFNHSGKVPKSIPEPTTAIGLTFAGGLGLLRKNKKLAQ